MPRVTAIMRAMNSPGDTLPENPPRDGAQRRIVGLMVALPLPVALLNFRDRHVPLTMIFGVSARIALLSVAIVLQI